MISTVLWTLLCLLCLSPLAAAASRTRLGRPLTYGACLIVCAVLAYAGIAALSLPPQHAWLPLGLPFSGAYFRLDALSGFFLAIIGVGGFGASLYALGYARNEEQPQRVLPFYPLFLAGLALVVVADDSFVFLFAWEVMSVASWALVLSHDRHAENRRAAQTYLLMAGLSGFALLLGFGVLMAEAGGYSFNAIRAAHPAAGIGTVVLVLALIGAGSKAGLVPLHVWLPQAHPAAPSHVSALMSGVMTKVAVYGFIRIGLDLLGPAAWWSAMIVLVVGGISAVLGILQALMEQDIKRLLACSTIENIGVVFLGLGLAMAFQANGLAFGATLALTAALYHALNHMLCKSLLFFGAGAVVNATGERSIEQLGGLIGRMPRTAIAMLAGCAAISALPPFNVFVSEWLTFQAILFRPDLPQWGLKLAVPAGGALLALAAALAAACFVRLYGIAFLGRPRSAAASQARETDTFSLAAMFGAAGLCLLAGVFPGTVINRLAPVVELLTGTALPAQSHAGFLTILPVAARQSSYSGLLIFVFVAVSVLLAAWCATRFGSRALRRAPAWDCGFPDLSPVTQYTAASFSQPIRRIFGPAVFRSRETVTIPPPGEIAPAWIEKRLHDPIWETMYLPLAAWVGLAANSMNRLQFLTIRRYLAFVFVSLVVLLLALALWQ
jgi:formate hydrogenlyase subunit 3/multisubunit Na+/H+ antiporter MnhD subunit